MGAGDTVGTGITEGPEKQKHTLHRVNNHGHKKSSFVHAQLKSFLFVV
jgi:hypothetical protein